MNDHHFDVSRLAESVGKIGLHDHLCMIYETKDEQLSAAIPFIKIGLDRGEKCLYIADSNSTATLKNAMCQQQINVDAAVTRGSLTITNKEIYRYQGAFNPDQWIELIEEFVRDAESAGFSGLRLTGEMTWLTGADPCPEQLIEFEAKFNHLAHDHNILGICQYDARLFRPEIILNILRTHPTVVYRGCVCENPYYITPEEFLSPHNSEREIQRMLTRMQEDTAKRERLRQNERRIREASEQHNKEIRTLIDTIPQQIWSGPADGSLDFCNERWRSYTGLRLDEVQGDGWQSMLHPDDRRRVLKAWRESVENGTPYEREERHRGADGRYRWFLARGVPMRDADGRIVRWYGTNTDIEDRKRAEEAIQQLSGRLLQSQDEERRRIARDLHDSTGQDLVALATMLGQLRTSIPSRDRKARKLFSECKALANRCIREVRTVSYVLHPPVLDQTGLVGAIRDYVQGFTKRSGIHVRLEVSPNVGRMARDVELALFRVVQEALTNIQRHSGSQHAKVRIDRNSNLTVEISDSRSRSSERLTRGRSEPPFKFGVGIPSMQERVNLIGGQLQIETTTRGTTVRVTVPSGDGREKASHSSS